MVRVNTSAFVVPMEARKDRSNDFPFFVYSALAECLVSVKRTGLISMIIVFSAAVFFMKMVSFAVVRLSFRSARYLRNITDFSVSNSPSHLVLQLHFEKELATENKK